jgi:hypothetical protein
MNNSATNAIEIVFLATKIEILRKNSWLTKYNITFAANILINYNE